MDEKEQKIILRMQRYAELQAFNLLSCLSNIHAVVPLMMICLRESRYRLVTFSHMSLVSGHAIITVALCILLRGFVAVTSTFSCPPQYQWQSSELCPQVAVVSSKLDVLSGMPYLLIKYDKDNILPPLVLLPTQTAHLLLAHPRIQQLDALVPPTDLLQIASRYGARNSRNRRS